MRLDRIVTLQLARPLRAMLGSASRRALPVLMYHSISDDPQPELAPYYKTTTSRTLFEEHIKTLTEQGYRSVDLGEALRLVNTKIVTPEKTVVITFDDGFRDFYDAAFPILKKYGHTAVMYLPTVFMGGDRRSFKGRECLTWSEVRELRGQGIHFGSHTVSHPKLYELSWTEIEEELARSKERIEREVGSEVSSFAYPFAFPQQDQRFTDKFTRILRQLGYRNCATTVVGRVQPGDNPFCVKRLPVNVCDDKALFAAKLAGAYDWFAGPQNVAKRAKRWLGWGKAATPQASDTTAPSNAVTQDSTL